MEARQNSYYYGQELPAVSMLNERQTYLRKKNREVVGSQAFNLEYDATPTDAELRDDLIGYLGEYRLQVQKFDYSLIFSSEEKGSHPQLRDKNRGEAMRIKSLRTIEERILKGQPVHREIAEEQGLAVLDEQLSRAVSGDTIFWGSPPGPKEQGYGDYGFLFYGKVAEGISGGKQLAMSAIRVENPTLVQYNAAMSDLTGMDWIMQSADDFLANPVVIGVVDEYTVDHILQKHFSFQFNEEDREMTEWILQTLDSAIDDSLGIIKNGTKQEKLQALHALENYALELKDQYKKEKTAEYPDTAPVVRLEAIIDQFGHEPPRSMGSCGSTEDNLTKSNMRLSPYASLRKALGLNEESEWFVCPQCGFEAVGPVGNQCPKCELTKEEYAKEGGEVC